MIGKLFVGEQLLEENYSSPIVIGSNIEYDFYTEALKFLVDLDTTFTEAKIKAYKEAANIGNVSVLNEGVIEAIKNMVKGFIDFIKSLFSKSSASSSSSSGNGDGKKVSKSSLLEKAITDKNKAATITFEGFYYKMSEADIQAGSKKVRDAEGGMDELKQTIIEHLRNGESEAKEIKMNITQVKDYVKAYDQLVEYDIKATQDRAIKEIQTNPTIKEGKSEEDVKKIITKATLYFSQVAIAVNEYGKAVDKVIALVKEAGKEKKEKED